jgi:hypothetical protein
MPPFYKAEAAVQQQSLCSSELASNKLTGDVLYGETEAAEATSKWTLLVSRDALLLESLVLCL